MDFDANFRNKRLCHRMKKDSIVSMLDLWLSQLSSVLHFPESYVILDKVLVPFIC